MTARTERAVCLTFVALMWLFFFWQALHTPVLLDDWYQLTWHRHHDLNLQSIWDYGYYNYFNFNPRVGDVIMMLVNGPPWIHLVFTPLVQLALLWLTFAITFGRWPKPNFRDLQFLMLMQVLIWLVIPVPGIVYFYRPFTTNYLWAFATMMLLFLPYRFALVADKPGPARHWLVPLMLPLGWIAGMGNEHTGPTAMVAMSLMLYFAWRKGRVRPWMIAGALGLFIGYPMLFLAPGQALRYAGIAMKYTPSFLLKARAVDGYMEISLDFVGEAQIAIDLVLIALLIAYRRARARGESLPGLSRVQVLTITALIVAASGMIATLFASPSVGERLLFAPAILFVGALLIVLDWLWFDRRVQRIMLVTCGIVFAYHIVRMVHVLGVGYEDNQARIAQLSSAPDNSVPKVPPYRVWKRSRWYWGDDFQYASLRQYVANEVYDLKNIEYDRPQFWTEPTPHDRYVVKRTWFPPMTPEEDAKYEPRYIPTYWEWTLVQLRRSLWFGPLKYVKGHSLIHYWVDMVDTPFEDPKHRPIHIFEWTPYKMKNVDGRMFDDPSGQPYVRIWAPTMPKGEIEVYVEACGSTKRIDTLLEDRWDHIGPLIPITLSCRGTHTTFVCEPTQCWMSGRYWR